MLAVPAPPRIMPPRRAPARPVSPSSRTEGFAQTAYEDSLGWAIGYGTRCEPGEYPNGITEAEADALLRQHLAETESYIDSAMSSLGVTLNQHQYDALASLTYNIGVGWFHSGYRLYNMLSAGIQYYTDEYIVNTFARYSNSASGEGTLDALVQRRLEEALIFLYGDYEFGGTPLYEYEYKELADGDYELFHRVWAEYSPAKFSDVPYTQWYYEYVSPLTYAGINGYEELPPAAASPQARRSAHPLAGAPAGAHGATGPALPRPRLARAHLR
ncbi:MAG: lysozyme [Oscillospiraceae bacterium]